MKYSERNNNHPKTSQKEHLHPPIYSRLLYFTFQTEIFEIIDALGVHELHVLAGRSSIGIAQVTLQSHVIIFDGATGETVFVQTGREASLLRRGVDQGVVQSTDHFVRHSFEGPRPKADVFWKIWFFNHNRDEIGRRITRLVFYDAWNVFVYRVEEHVGVSAWPRRRLHTWHADSREYFLT